MKLFDTSVQELKYKVLKDVATLAFEDRLETGLLTSPERIVPGPQPTMRCCIYKAVSYTHLDVYKRQDRSGHWHCLWAGPGISGIHGDGSHSHDFPRLYLV